MDQQSLPVFVQTGFLTMHMGCLKLLELLPVQVFAVPLAVEPAGFVDCGVYCYYGRCFVAAVKALVLRVTHAALLLDAIQKTHSPILFHLNGSLRYVHSWLGQSLRHYR